MRRALWVAGTFDKAETVPKGWDGDDAWIHYTKGEIILLILETVSLAGWRKVSLVPFIEGFGY